MRDHDISHDLYEYGCSLLGEFVILAYLEVFSSKVFLEGLYFGIGLVVDEFLEVILVDLFNLKSTFTGECFLVVANQVGSVWFRNVRLGVYPYYFRYLEDRVWWGWLWSLLDISRWIFRVWS